MVSVLTRVKVADNCGARIAQCIKLLGGSLPRRSLAGKIVIIVIKTINTKKKKIKVGAVLRALVVRTAAVFFRDYGVWVRFGENSVILINKRKAPQSKRLRGPFLKEICLRYNLLGTITRFVI